MSSNGNDRVIPWLNDAYAMEKALVQVLEHRISDVKDFPGVRQMDERHLEETRHHVELVGGCIERLGEQPSSVKSVMGTVFGAMQAPMTGFAQDKVVKNCLTDYAAEQFEVISYRALIEVASQVGDTETVSICEQIMREDQAMADRIVLALPTIIGGHMDGTGDDHTEGRGDDDTEGTGDDHAGEAVPDWDPTENTTTPTA